MGIVLVWLVRFLGFFSPMLHSLTDMPGRGFWNFTYCVSGNYFTNFHAMTGKTGENSGQAPNCRAEIGFQTAESPSIHCLPQVPHWPFKDALVLGHTPDGLLTGILMVFLRPLALLPRTGVRARRNAGFERILRLAALAFPMAPGLRLWRGQGGGSHG